MTPAAGSFDRLARWYRLLELLAFGLDLERARFALLDRLGGCRSILVAGEGDGRCLARLARIAPAARIDCLDASGAMLARARARIAAASARPGVRFIQADAATVPLGRRSYDAVVTLFFLDCFDEPGAAAVVRRFSRALRESALWLHADFAVPAGRLAGWRARAWLRLLYAFFGATTGVRARRLPPAEGLIGRAGFSPVATRTRQAGLLRSVLFRR